MCQLKIGWAEEEFVLTKPVSIIGQFAERISEYIEKPITATAFAVEANGDQMVLCSVDLVAVSSYLLSTVRERLKDNDAGLDPMKIVLAATHIHTGPGYKGYGAMDYVRAMLEKELPSDKKYVERADTKRDDLMTADELLEEISSKIVKAILDAWNDRKAGSYVNAFGRAVVGHCRRATYSDGTAQMWGDTNTAVFEALEGGNDSGIELLYIFDKDKKLTGVVANLACTAQCVQHRSFVSPDFWGETKMLLRKHFGEGLFLLPLCSVAGDQCPVDLIRWVEPESDVNDPNMIRKNPPIRKADPSMFDLSGMRKAGKRVAREIIDVFAEGLDEMQSDVPFVHRVHRMQLPLRRVTLTEEKEAKRAIREYLANKPGDVDYTDAANLQVHLGVLTRKKVQDTVDITEAEVHIIRLGNIAIATNPYEMFLDYGNQIKARSSAEQTFLVQLANGSEGYVPTKKAEAGGHYSAFISSGNIGHQGGEQLVRETLTAIRNMF
ncbi:MAG: hypothetical protein IJF61_05485 [Clostridia bacterium]|nr:hypothetical protein [Clostridia bacterium]